MARTTRSRLSEARVRTAHADDTKHGRQLFDGLGSNGLYLQVTPGGAKCWVQQLMVPNAATGKSRRVRIGLGAWPRVTLAQARKAAFACDMIRYEAVGVCVMQKMVVNLAVEEKINQTQRLVTVFDEIARHSPEGMNSKARVEEVGWKRAVQERNDGTFDWTRTNRSTE